MRQDEWAPSTHWWCEQVAWADTADRAGMCQPAWSTSSAPCLPAVTRLAIAARCRLIAPMVHQGGQTPFAYFCPEDEFRPPSSQAAPDKRHLRLFAENLISLQAEHCPAGKGFRRGARSRVSAA